jgi:hypothetical protein
MDARNSSLAGVSPAVEQTIAYKAKGQAVDFAAF